MTNLAHPPQNFTAAERREALGTRLIQLSVTPPVARANGVMNRSLIGRVFPVEIENRRCPDLIFFYMKVVGRQASLSPQSRSQ